MFKDRDRSPERFRYRLGLFAGQAAIAFGLSAVASGLWTMHEGSEYQQAAIECWTGSDSHPVICPDSKAGYDKVKLGLAGTWIGAMSAFGGFVSIVHAKTRREVDEVPFANRDVSSYLDEVILPNNPDGVILYRGEPLPPAPRHPAEPDYPEN